VIAVDVANELEQEYSHESGLDLIRRSNSITRTILTRLQSRQADIIITPDLGQLSWVSYECIDSCIKLGETAARKELPAIKKKIASLKHPLISQFLG